MACTFSCATSEYDGTKRLAAPSQTPESAGLEDAGHIVWWKAGGVNYYPKGENFTVSASCHVDSLVTAASAQAAIDAEKAKVAEYDAEKARLGRVLMTMQEAIPTAYHPNGAGLRLFINHLKDSATAAEARADRLAKFGQHINWELSFCYLDDESEPGCWAVHSVNGGRNDREWTLIGRGDTPDDAIRAALQQETQP